MLIVAEGLDAPHSIAVKPFAYVALVIGLSYINFVVSDVTYAAMCRLS